jgi:acetylornithine deacetylase
MPTAIPTTSTATEILRDLVAIPSVSALSNSPILDYIAALLGPAGWSMQRLPYTTADGTEKANLIAFPRQFADVLPAVELLFVCHTDTVPFQGNWPTATQLVERDGMLHGCGACDVKGSLAGLLAAVLETPADVIPIPVAFAFTADEEIGCIGATHLVAGGTIRPRRVIVCEPTSLRPAVAGKCYGLAEVHVLGHEAHSAFPGKGVSAINVAAQLIHSVEMFARNHSFSTNPLFTPPHTTFNVGVLRGGTAKNIIAGECTFLLEWRPLPEEDPGHGGEILKQLVAEVVSSNPGCAIDVRILRADSGFANEPDTLLGSGLSSIFGRPFTGISFGSEATRLLALAEEAIVVGPGDMESAHSERECIPLDELNEWVRAVCRLLRSGIEEDRIRADSFTPGNRLISDIKEASKPSSLKASTIQTTK